MSKRKIFYIIGQLDIGGAEIHLLKILQKINKKNYDVKLFSLRGGGQLEEEFYQAGIELSNTRKGKLGFYGKFKTLLSLCIILYKEQPNIIHYFLPEAYLIGACCSIFSPSSIKVMSRRSLNLYQAKRPYIKYTERFFHKFMTLILGNSKAVINDLKSEGVNDDKLTLIYNGIEIPQATNEKSKSEFRKKLGVSENQLVLTVVSNLIPYKGHKDLLRALSLIQSDLPKKWVLYCIGRDDGYIEELSDFTIELNLVDNVKFIGHTRNIAEYLIASDIGLLPSHQEGFSNSLLEGMAYGLPMIATNVGGNSEVITDGLNGFIVPAHDSNQLGDKIRTLSNDTELRKTLGKAACQLIKSNYTLNKCVDKYISTYEKLLDRKVATTQL